MRFPRVLIVVILLTSMLPAAQFGAIGDVDGHDDEVIPVLEATDPVQGKLTMKVNETSTSRPWPRTLTGTL